MKAKTIKAHLEEHWFYTLFALLGITMAFKHAEKPLFSLIFALMGGYSLFQTTPFSKRTKFIAQAGFFFLLGAYMLHAGFKAERDYINIILGTTLVIFSLITAFAVRKMKPELVLSPQEAALKNAIEEKRKTDPLIGAKLGANALIQQLSADMSAQNPKGVHLESLLVMLGSLGGFSCQMAIHEGVAKSKKGSSKPLMEVRGADGRKYYFGDLLNAILAEEKISFFAFAGGSVGAKGGKLPDMQELLGHVSSSLGTENFGIPRYPEGHSAADTPYNFVKALWVSLLPNLKFYCHSPREWPIAFGIAVQNVIEQGKEHIPPEIALQIAMEAAAPMSKIDYQEIVHPHASAP